MPIPQFVSAFVSGMPNVAHRTELWSEFQNIISKLHATGIVTEVWVDGSFVTTAPKPGDIDFVVIANWAEYESNPAYKDLLDSFIENHDSIWGRCDAHVGFRAPEGHEYHEAGKAEIRGWLNAYGRDEGLGQKGIVVLDI